MIRHVFSVVGYVSYISFSAVAYCQDGGGESAARRGYGAVCAETNEFANEVLNSGEKLRISGSRESLEAAVEYYSQALSIYKQTGNISGQAVASINTGLAFIHLGYYERAFGSFMEGYSVSWASELSDATINAGRALSGAGEARRLSGQYDEAIALFEESRKFLESADDPVGKAAALHNLALVYDLTGRYRTALDYFEESLEITKSHALYLNSAHTLTSIGDVYGSLGENEYSLGYYVDALQMARRSGSRDTTDVEYFYANTYHSMAEVYLVLNLHEQAVSAFEASVEHRRKLGNPRLEILPEIGIAKVYQSAAMKEGVSDEEKLKNLRIAGGLLKGIIYRLQEFRDYSNTAKSLNSLGAIHLQMNEYDLASTRTRQALDLAQDLGDVRIEGTSLYQLGRIEQVSGNLELSRHYLELAVACAETIRAGVPGPGLKASFSNSIHEYYYSYVDVLMELHLKYPKGGYDRIAFDVTEKSRARSLLDQLAKPDLEAQLYSRAEPQILERIQEIKAKLGDLRKESIAKFDFTAPRDQFVEQTKSLQKEYRHLIDRTYLGESQGRAGRVSDLAAIQNALDPDTVLVSYFSTIQSLYVFVVKKDQLLSCSLSADKGEVLSLIEGVKDRRRETLERLYDHLVRPIEDWLVDAGLHENATFLKVGIIPHRVLHYLSFSALYDGENYSLEKFPLIFYLPSASVLSSIQDKQVKAQGRSLVMAFSRPEGMSFLQHAESEALSVAAKLGVEPLLGSRSTEAALRNRASRVNILHIASHAQVNSEIPVFSRLVLAPDGNDDGFLEVHEVHRLNLNNAELVTLSGCDTHRGPYDQGDELIALHRSFLHAGASSVVASLWPIPDLVAKEFMVILYEEISQGSSKIQALHRAQVGTRKLFPDPVDWAGFVLTGAPE